MKKYTKLLVIVMLVSMIMGCVSQELKDSLGAVTGAVGGGLIGKKLGGDKGAIVGALVGAAVGGALTHYLTKQDEENIQTVFKTGETDQKYSWCSADSSRSMTTGDIGNCASGNKISATPGKFQSLSNSEGKREECRYVQIEVLDENGKLKNDEQKVCK